MNGQRSIMRFLAGLAVLAILVCLAGCVAMQRKPKQAAAPVVPPGPMPEKNYFEDLGEGMKIEMVWIPGGEFEMGSPLPAADLAGLYPAGGARPADFADELPRTKVKVDGFWISRYEVTADQYKRIKWRAPKPAKETLDPIDKVLWVDANWFCQELSERRQKKYSLPTEAQWEYACLAGSKGLFSCAMNPEDIDKHVWHLANSDGRAHPVGTKEANPWGLFDMQGNVAEWCVSMYRPYPYNPVDGRDDAKAHGTRVVRGGSYREPWAGCRATIRYHETDRAGFRIVCTSWTMDR